MGLSPQEIASIVRVDQDTVTNYLKQYNQNGLEGLLEDNYRIPTSQIEAYIPQLKEIFEPNPPHTINQAIEIIFNLTGVSLKYSAGRDFLTKIGLKRRRAGLVPGKALDDDEQKQAQQEFHDNKLQPVLDEAKAGKHTVLFTDAAHLVMGAY